MRMTGNHLGADSPRYAGEVEALFLTAHLAVIDDLQKQIAQFAFQVIPGFALDGIGNLVGFLDRVGRNRGEILLDVPRAAGLGIAEAAHDFDQLRCAVGHVVNRIVVSHVSPLARMFGRRSFRRKRWEVQWLWKLQQSRFTK